MNIKDFITTDSISNYINLFITFVFANIVSKYLTTFIDLHISSWTHNKLDKIKYDKTLAFEIMELFNHKELKKVLDDIYKGYYSPEQSDNISKLFEVGKYKRFFSRKIQNVFEKYFHSFQELKDFIIPLYTRNSHLNLILRHTHEDDENCSSITDKEIQKICLLADIVEVNYIEYEKCIRKYLPNVFINH